MDEQLPPFMSQPLQFQMPQFVLGGTPNLAHGGGAEVLPCMYGAGPHAWSDLDKQWYEHGAAPTRYYPFDDLGAQPPPASSGPASRPFEFTDSPQEPPEPAVPPPDAEQPFPDAEQQQYAIAAPFPQYPAAALSAFAFPTLSALDPTAPLPPIPSNGLPLYSASGFDMLKMLGKVATRPNPKIMLGPVDMTCSFVVVDVRRFDAPIVYASPTFTRLTGYPESEVLGRNCRFLQAPTGQVARGEPRRFTAPDAVRHLQKCLLQEKECQASLINYRKDGGAFINLVTVIPVAADDASDDVTHHVGFQVDLAEQPGAILQRLRDGSYIVNYSMGPGGPPRAPWERRTRGVSQELLDMLRAGSAWALGADPGGKPVRDHERAALHALLLENTDDFVHVVSLKGALLYVAPSVHRVLGYTAADLIGTSIADLCHPADIVPLMRELKEASAAPPAPATPAPPPPPRPPALFALPPPPPPPPKPIALLFRARHASGRFVWLEARGRLHVEAGKGRKAVVLAGRAARVPRLPWRGLGAPDGAWGLVAPHGLVLAGAGALRAGASLAAGVAPADARRVAEVLAGAACAPRAEPRAVRCALRGGGGEAAELRFFAPGGAQAGVPPSLVFQLRAPAPEAEEGGAGEGGEGGEGDVLAALDAARTTSWQYELTRLRFENERMRAEVAALERAHAREPAMASLQPHPPAKRARAP